MGFKIYNASAGSGKTFNLTIEYLKILFKSFDENTYRRILAITFTNAAVKEMKERILKTLIAFTKNPIPDKYFPYYSKLESELQNDKFHIDIVAKSKKIVKTLIHDYAAFDIMTIDKFTLKIIRTFENDLKLPHQFDVTLDTDTLLKEAIDRVIMYAGEDDQLTDVLINFAKTKSDESKSWKIENDIYEIAKVILNDSFFEKINGLIRFEVADFINSKDQIVNKIALIKSKIQQLARQIFNELEVNNFTESDFPRGTFYNEIQRIANLNFDDFDDFKISNVKLNKSSKNQVLFESFETKWQDIVIELQTLFSRVKVFRLLLKEIIPLSLINSVFTEYKEVLKEQNLLSLSDFNKIINQEIKNEPAPFIYERLGEKYRHFFIDEFQDTSVLQWENLIPLIGNSLVSMEGNVPGSLMLVGDPKQAIYRFRGGKAEQFIKLSNQENVFPIEQEIIHLNTNYRSYENIILFNNDFFKFISHLFTNENYRKIYEVDSFQYANDNKGGYVTIKFVDLNNIEEVDDDFDESIKPSDQMVLNELYNRIQECLKQNYSYSDIAILVRRTKKSYQIAKFLNEKGIKVLSSDSLLIKNSTEVQFLIHFLNFIDNYENKDAKSNVLYYIGKNVIYSESIHSFLNHYTHATIDDFQKLLDTSNISFKFSESRKKSIYDLVEYICFYFLKEKTTTSYVQHFIDLILEYDIKSQATISDFLEYWDKIGSEKKIPASLGEDAIQLMTIHKSKGLEFPIVIFPFADYESNNNRFAKMWVDVSDQEIHLPELYLKRDKSFENYSDDFENDYKNDLEEDLLEIINLLYVVLTRAKNELHIITSAQFVNNGGFSTAQKIRKYFYDYVISKNSDFKIEDYYEFGSKTLKKDIQDHTNSIQLIENVSQRMNFEAIKIAKNEALMWATNQQEAIEFGNIIHKTMAYINHKTDLDEAVNRAVFNGIIVFDMLDIIKDHVYSILNHPELIDFFQPNRIIYNETTIISNNKKNSIPDRVEIDGVNAYILDYKTGVASKKHEDQVNEYAEILSEMGYNVIKKTLIYISKNLKVINLQN